MNIVARVVWRSKALPTSSGVGEGPPQVSRLTDPHYQLVTRTSYNATDQLVGRIQHIHHYNIRLLNNKMEFELSITPSDYEPLWIDHCDPDVLLSAFDLDMHEHEDSRVPCSGFPDSPNPATFPLYKSQRSALTLVQSQAHICSTSSMIFL